MGISAAGAALTSRAKPQMGQRSAVSGYEVPQMSQIILFMVFLLVFSQSVPLLPAIIPLFSPENNYKNLAFF
jgi:hypothetical protein